MCVGLIQSVEGLIRIKRLKFPQVRDSSPCLTAFKWKQLLFLDRESAGFQTGTTPLAFLVLRPLDLDRNYTIGSPGLQLADLP